MYLTRMELDVDKRRTMIALTSPNVLHGAIESSFSGGGERRLWRIDEFQGKYYLLLLSAQVPELTRLAQQFGVEEREQLWETKSYDPLLERVQRDSVWQFRLTANPTTSVKSANPGVRGTVHAHITPEHQISWLKEQGINHGFSIIPEDVYVMSNRWLQFHKGGERKHPVTLLAVTFEGILQVTDSACFRETLTHGIGRGKAFGLGLLTVMRPRR